MIFSSESRRQQLFSDVSDADWNDWRWQVANRAETLEDLKKYITLTAEEKEGVRACLGTLRMAITPYYLYQCDLSMGLEHFRTPVSKGIEIIEALRGHTSGYCVPTFVVDAPGGGGKTPVMPQYVISQTPHKVVLRNYEGVITTYTEPEYYEEICQCEFCKAERAGRRKAALMGVAGLERGQALSMEPANLERRKREGR